MCEEFKWIQLAQNSVHWDDLTSRQILYPQNGGRRFFSNVQTARRHFPNSMILIRWWKFAVRAIWRIYGTNYQQSQVMSSLNLYHSGPKVNFITFGLTCLL